MAFSTAKKPKALRYCNSADIFLGEDIAAGMLGIM